MTKSTNILTMMMRFPISLIYSEVNDKLRSENAYNAFSIIPRIELGLKQLAAYTPRSIKYHHNEHKAIEKLQDYGLPFRMWIDPFLNNDWIGRSKDLMPSHSFKHSTIAATKFNLEKKVVSKNKSISIYCRGGKGL